MPEKCDSSGSTLSAMPCSVTHLRTRMPMAAILSSKPSPLSGPPHPDADAVVAPLAAHVEGGERADDPFLQRGDEGPHVRLAPVEVEHHIGHPLAGAVIGELPAAAGLVDRKARLDQFLRLGAGAGGVERRMLQQPDLLGRAARRDRGHPLVHRGERRLIGHRRLADAPLHRRLALGAAPASGPRRAGADINHSFTIPC